MPFARLSLMAFPALVVSAVFVAGIARAEASGAPAVWPRDATTGGALTKTIPVSTAKSKIEPLAAGRSTVVSFSHAPFPYEGLIPKKETPFFDVVQDGRRGHSSVRAGVYWEDETYSDRSVLLALPKGFDLRRSAVMIVFLHGNNALLERDVVLRQQVVDQVEASGLNAVLIAPQFAHDATDSSAGNFWKPGFFARFLKEAAARLAKFYGAPATAAAFERMPVILVAYSGGYNPAAYALAVGGEGRRMRGVVLLDALYGEEDKFVDWVTRARRSAFFFSAYSLSSADANTDVEAALKANPHLDVRDAAPRHLTAGTVTFIGTTDPSIMHENFMTVAWVPWPLQWVLARVPGYPR